MEKVDDQEKLQTMLAQMGSYRELMEVLKQQLVALSNALAEVSATTESLETLRKQAPSTEILVPIGADSFVPAKLGPVDKVIVGLGAEVATDMAPEKAIEKLKLRADEIEKSIAQTREEIVKTDERINTIRPEAERLLQKIKGQSD